MKKFILITIILFTCISANAVFVDHPSNVALLHCDDTQTNWWADATNYWLVTPDDNSSGRTACEPILNMAFGAFNMDSNTIPAFVTNSPYGGKYLEFDGVNDSIYVNNGWLGDDSVSLDFSFRWLGLPDPSDNFAGIFGCVPWRCYLMDDGTGNGFLNFLISPGEVWLVTNAADMILLSSNVWYDVHFDWFEHNMKMIVNNQTNSMYMPADLDSSSGNLNIGYGFWVASRLFKGNLDEIRYGYVIPEPAIFGLLSLFSLALLRGK